MTTELQAELDTKVETVSKAETLGSTKVEFSGEELKEVDSITAEPDSYLETVGDYVGAEAIGAYLSKLIGGVTEAFQEAGQAYAEHTAKPNYEGRLNEALTEPRFGGGEATKLVNDAPHKELQTPGLEKHGGNLEQNKPHVEPVITHPIKDTTPTINEIEHHIVQPGESLSKIAQQEYGSAAEWPRIYEANKALIGANPAMIRVGQNLVIPPFSGGQVFNNVIVPDKPFEPKPPVTPPDGGTGQAVESNPERLEQIARLEQKIETLTKDPNGITERNITNNPPLDGQRIALKEQLEALDRDLLRNKVTPETLNEYTARYNNLHDQYNQVSIGLYKNHVDAVPLEYADKSTLDRLLYNKTILDRAIERGASAAEIDSLVDNSWRDYDDAKMGRDTNHHMAGGHVPNPVEGEAIANSERDDAARIDKAVS